MLRRLVLAILVIAYLAIVAMYFVSDVSSTPKTAARPVGSAAVSPLICRPGSMGASLRCAAGVRAVAPAATPPGQTGIDLSNNDPSFGRWRTIRQRASFAYFKVSEGTGFIDGTAKGMAAEARAAGLLVGGYDFLHVCGDNPESEAKVFVNAARADGLLVPGTLPLVADFESAFGSCNRSAWLRVWSRYVLRHAGRDGVYSDPGFYSPSVGCFSEATVGWVADLGGFTVLCGLPTRLFQFSWIYWDGTASVDGDVFRGSYAQLAALAGHAKPKPHLTHGQAVAYLRELDRLLGAYDRRSNPHGHNCAHPPYRHAFPSSRYNDACAEWAREKRQTEKEIR